jgi:hypothetical protein
MFIAETNLSVVCLIRLLIQTTAKGTTTMTFRLEENVVNMLRAECDRRHISLNSMINQFFKGYAEWGMYESKVGLMSFLRPVAVELFKRVSKK